MEALLICRRLLFLCFVFFSWTGVSDSLSRHPCIQCVCLCVRVCVLKLDFRRVVIVYFLFCIFFRCRSWTCRHGWIAKPSRNTVVSCTMLFSVVFLRCIFTRLPFLGLRLFLIKIYRQSCIVLFINSSGHLHVNQLVFAFYLWTPRQQRKWCWAQYMQ